ncbi:sarcoplasmic calcium-binding protein-like [Mercenaria mercenaria]|uniref:sarcoplasmic calcium-binding protein-like n=1 Tax=Mercenaria mercenaria TaxID=6596 RepID=UPI00234F954B|nr:sarcoplasmic calcium-binding protein-like [Mercenaria mercenaria]
MANEYLIKKWRMCFKLMDVKHAGQISREDEKQEEEAYVKLAHLEGKRKEEILETSHRLWNNFVFRGKPGPITEEEFIDMTNTEYKTDKAKFIADMRKDCADDMSCFDLKQQGFVTEEEFIMGCKAAGMENEKWNRDFFRSFNPTDGKVDVNVMIEDWVQFLTEDDSSKKDAIMDAMQSYQNL